MDANLKADFIQLDFEQARTKHLLFKSRLRSILYGADMDEAPVVSHFECAVGKWIYGHALQQYDHIPEIHELERVHAAIHTSAKELVALYKSGKVIEARSGLEGMEKIANHLIQLLSVAEAKVKENPSQELINKDYRHLLDSGLKELYELQKENHALDTRIKLSEKRYAELIHRLPIAVYTCDAEGYIELYNEAAVQLWGRNPEIGKDKWCGWWKIYDKEGIPIAPEECPMAIAICEGRIVNTEILIERPDGSKRSVIPHPQPLYDADGKIFGAINTLIDITPQIDAQKIIEISEQHLANIIRQVNAGISQTDNTGKFREVNDRFCEITGYSKVELLHSCMQDITHPDDMQRSVQLLKEHVKIGDRFFIEKRYLKKDGSIIWVSNSISLVNGPQNDLLNVSVCIDITATKILEQKNQQLLLMEQNARQEIQNLFLQAPAILCILRGPKHIYELANELYMQHIGHRDVIGKPIREALPELEGQGIYEFLDEVYKTGTPFLGNEIPAALNKGDGSNKEGFFNFIYQPLKDIQGNIDGIFVIAVEVTDQVNARKKVEVSKELFSTLANNIQNLAWIADSEGWIFWYNESWYAYTGTTLEDMEGWGWKSVHNPETLPSVLERWQHSISNGLPFEMVFPLRRADGIFHQFLTRVTPIHNSTGEIVRWVGTNTDINEQKKAEEQLEEKVTERTLALKEANESLQQKNSEIALSKYNKRFLTDFSERFAAYNFHDEFFNAAVVYIAELTKIDYIFIGKLEHDGKDKFSIQTIALSAFGSLVKNIKYPLPDGPCEQVIRATLYSYPENCRVTFPKNQTLIQFNVEGYIGFPLHDSEGHAIGLIAVMHETKIDDPETVSSILKIVAKRTEIEMERIKYEEVLEKYNKTLAEKNRQLEKMNKELEEFTYVSSHDLQEQLRKIQTFSSIIFEKESGILSENGKRYFNRIQETAKRMQQLIQDLLAFSRLKVSESEFETVDLDTIITAVTADFKEIIQETKATIETGKLGMARVIPFQFRQLMLNLIGNALKFSKPGIPPKIIITSSIIKGEEVPAANLPEGKEYCHIIVSDQGIGFEPHFNDRIFKVFQRLHSQEAYAGTGIGLAIVKKIVENHNGIIKATGELNKGTTFDIYIPVI